MPALTSIIAGAAIATGVAGTVVTAKQNKKIQKQADADAKKAEIAAKEAAKLKGPQTNDLRIKLGAQDVPGLGTGGSSEKGTATRKSSVGVAASSVLGAGGIMKRVGGL